MFNKTTIHGQQDRIIPIDKTINHNYAPTTEQAKYLDELKKEAWSSVVHSAIESVGDNIVSYGVIRTHTDNFKNKLLTRIVFSLNGKEFDIPVEIDDYDQDASEKLIDVLFVNIAEQITIELLRKSIIPKIVTGKLNENQNI